MGRDKTYEKMKGLYLAHNEKYPNIYYLDMRTCRKKFSQISDQELVLLKDMGIDILWMGSLFEESDYSYKLNNYWAKKENRPNAVASSYSIKKYKIKKSFGGEKEFRDFVLRAKTLGIRVIIDIVINHMAVDSPLVISHPQIFMKPPPEVIKKEKREWLELKPENEMSPIFRHPASGEIFYFAGGRETLTGNRFKWGDCIQVNLTNPDARLCFEGIVLYYAELMGGGGGFRFDAMHHLARKEIKAVWFSHLSDEEFDRIYPPSEDFLRNLLKKLKDKHPDILLIAEYFGNEGDEFLNIGFDFYYEPIIREFLIKFDMPGLKSFLEKISRGQKFRFLKYLENHDTWTRITSILGKEECLAAVVILMTLPGATLIMSGQERGYSKWVPSAIRIYGPQEKEDIDFVDLYHRLGKINSMPMFKNGRFNLLQTDEVEAGENLILFERTYDDQRAIIAVNYGKIPTSFKIPFQDKLFEVSLPPWGSKIFEVKNNSLNIIFDSSDRKPNLDNTALSKDSETSKRLTWYKRLMTFL